MRNIVAGAMVVVMALCVFAGVVALGGVTPDLFAVSYVLAAVLVLAWAAKLFFAPVVSWKKSPVHIPVLAFFLYALFRYFTSPLEYDGRLEVLNIGLYTAVYFACAANFHRSRDRMIFIAALTLLVLLESGYALWQFWTKSTQVLSYVRPGIYKGRGSGTYICPNHLAGLIEIILPLLIARVVLWRPSKSTAQSSVLFKVLLAYAALMALMALTSTLSRASWIATTVALLTFLLWGQWEWRQLWPRLLGGAAAIGILILIAVNVGPIRTYILMSFNEPSAAKPVALTDQTLGLRTLMWKDTLAMIRDHPLLGTGPATWQWFHYSYQPKELQVGPDYAHNDILNLASDYGLIGFALVLVAIIAFFRHAGTFMGPSNSSEHRSFAIGAAVALTAIILHSWFDFNMHIPGNALLLSALLGFTVAMEDSGKRYPRVEMNRVFRYSLGAVLVALTAAGLWFVKQAAFATHYKHQGDKYKSFLYWDDALAFYKRSLAIDPRDPTPYVRMADIYRVQSIGRVDPARKSEREELARQAIDLYQKSLDLNPRQPAVIAMMAQSYGLAGKPKEAVETYHKAIAIAPTSAYLYQELGLFYMRQGDEEKATAALENSIQLFWTEVAAYNLQELKSK